MKISLFDLKAQYKALKKEVNEVFSSVSSTGSFIKGRFLEEFEKKFARFIGVKYCVGVASGTDALHLALRVLDIKRGDEVIMPVNTFIASPYATLYTGAKPVFVDIDPETYNIDVNKIESKIAKKTKALLPVHLYGQPADMDKIMFIAKKYNLAVIEDSCQAHGAIYKKRKVGGFGDLSVSSFYPGKNLGAYGDGGSITTNSKKFAERIVRLREYGGITKYLYDEIGMNSRLDALQAAILTVKLKYLKKWNARRRKLASYYNRKFKEEVPHIVTSHVIDNVVPVYHLYVIRIPRRDQLAKFLEIRGIHTGIHYPIPLHLQKSLKFLGYKKGDFPVAEKVCSEILSLPMYPELTHSQQDYIVKSIREFFDHEN